MRLQYPLQALIRNIGGFIIMYPFKKCFRVTRLKGLFGFQVWVVSQFEFIFLDV
jgi:hypothetical protein